jgi:hypothetical protein
MQIAYEGNSCFHCTVTVAVTESKSRNHWHSQDNMQEGQKEEDITHQNDELNLGRCPVQD